MIAATGLAQGRQADPALAERAVRDAMARSGLDHPQAVLLYLTAEFAHDPQPAITAAARAAGCLQVAGCTAAGVFTEEDWVLDAPAAAALVLGEGTGLSPAPRGEAGPVLTLAAPNALDMLWLQGGGQRFGGVSGDATGQGPYSVWSGGRVQASGRCELVLAGSMPDIGLSQGVKPLCPPRPVARVAGHDILALGDGDALASLARELPLSQRAPERIPTHLLMAGLPYGEPEQAVAEGRYNLLPVVAVNPGDKSVTVAGRLAPGTALFWALRQPHAAEQEMAALLDSLARKRTREPAFALMFPCMGRGPYFYGGVDKDILAVKKRHPALPCIGFYGNGEIASQNGSNRLLQYSVVLALGYGHV
ncbi:MAG: FIST C-terminal domain-containing protein [Pseudomonadota bacterium]